MSWKHARALVERRTLKLALGVLEEHGRDPLGSEGTARMATAARHHAKKRQKESSNVVTNKV